MVEEPKAALTRWLTEGFERRELEKLHDDRTRLEIPGQKEWYNALACLDDPYFNRRLERDQLLMMSYKGRRSDDVVEALRSTSAPDKINTGVQPVTEELRKRADRYKTSE